MRRDPSEDPEPVNDLLQDVAWTGVILGVIVFMVKAYGLF